MINWQSVIINSFWIFGLALLLAAFSYFYWNAAENGRALRTELSSIGFLRWFWAAMLLVGIGLLGASQQVWEMAVWAGLLLLAVTNIVLLSRKTAQ